MRGLVLAATVILPLSAGPSIVGVALAADVPVKAPPLPQVYNWIGYYVGAHAGYGGGTKDWSAPLEGFFDGEGFLAGGQIGINQQIGGGWVLGVEADASWSGFKADQTNVLAITALATRTDTLESKFDWMASLAFRAGIAADRLWVYGKFGAAVLHERHTFNSLLVGPGGVATQFVTGSETRIGPLVGFGAEYGFGGNWSAKVEYNYIPFADQSVEVSRTQTVNGDTTFLTFDQRIGQSLHFVKAGVNYRLGPAPPPAVPAPVRAAGYDWSGLYLGAQVGYGWGHKKWDDLLTVDVSGWFGGGQIGFNAQSGRVVVGVEAEGLWTGVDGTSAFFAGATVLTNELKWLAMATGRLGYTPWERGLVYLKGGVALADERHAANIVSGDTFVLAGDRLRSGWVAGGGVEHAFAGNWSLRAEYNFIDFGKRFETLNGTITTTGTATGTFPFLLDFEIKQHLHLVKLGLNYHFGAAPAATITKY